MTLWTSQMEMSLCVLDQAIYLCRHSLALCERRLAKKLLELPDELIVFRRHASDLSHVEGHGELGVLREEATNATHLVN